MRKSRGKDSVYTSVDGGYDIGIIVYNIFKADAKDDIARFIMANSEVKYERGEMQAALLVLRML